jgi:hypothetical protein
LGTRGSLNEQNKKGERCKTCQGEVRTPSIETEYSLFQKCKKNKNNHVHDYQRY